VRATEREERGSLSSKEKKPILKPVGCVTVQKIGGKKGGNILGRKENRAMRARSAKEMRVPQSTRRVAGDAARQGPKGRRWDGVARAFDDLWKRKGKGT